MGGRRAAKIRSRPLNRHRSRWDLISVRRQKNIETSQREEGQGGWGWGLNDRQVETDFSHCDVFKATDIYSKCQRAIFYICIKAPFSLIIFKAKYIFVSGKASDTAFNPSSGIIILSKPGRKYCTGWIVLISKWMWCESMLTSHNKQESRGDESSSERLHLGSAPLRTHANERLQQPSGKSIQWLLRDFTTVSPRAVLEGTSEDRSRH